MFRLALHSYPQVSQRSPLVRGTHIHDILYYAGSGVALQCSARAERVKIRWLISLGGVRLFVAGNFVLVATVVRRNGMFAVYQQLDCVASSPALSRLSASVTVLE